MDWLRATRNNYAHAQYGVPEDPQDRRIFRISFFSDTGRKTRRDFITVETVEADIVRAKGLILALWQLLR